MTLNEPPVFVGLGHESGQHAPGDRWSDRHLARVMHHVLLAHGRSVQVLRANTAKDSHIGLAINNDPAIPVVEDAATIAAARQMQWTIVRPNLIWNGATWLDPMLKGSYPDGVLQLWGNLLPIQAGDMETIAQPLDFIGLNIYQGYYASVKADGTPTPVQEHPGHPRTNMDWKVTPGALYWSPQYRYERYGLPIYITENGLGSMDWVSVDGAVHDTGRIDFMHRYLAEFKRAGADGVPIAGYFHWSVLDNYEWAEGYRKRFGMIYVDYVTQQRILKDSALWYRGVIASNGAAL
jgi:beta-glucosidase